MSIGMAAVIGQVLTFLTVIAGFAYQYMRDAQRHKWDQEERKSIAEAALATGQQTERRLSNQIDENTQVSRTAFKEANDVNLKLHALGLDLKLKKDA